MSKVEVLQMSNKEYRGLDMPSYSLIKRLDDFGPRNFTKSFKIEGDPIDFGLYVDCMMFTPEEENEMFYVESIEKPTNQLLELANYIIYNLSPDQELTNEYVESLSSDLKLFGSTKDREKRIANFNNDLFWNYIKVMRLNHGKIILSNYVKNEALEAIDILTNHVKTRHLFSMSEGQESLHQLQLTAKIGATEVKVMLDKVIIDHNKKVVSGYDLKCTDVRQITFPYWFKKMKYYLQASLYNLLLLFYTEQFYPGYTVDQFRFIVYSKSDKYPFVWKVSDSMLQNGWFGFTDEKGVYHKGVDKLLKEYTYYKESNNFDIEVDFIENSEMELL